MKKLFIFLLLLTAQVKPSSKLCIHYYFPDNQGQCYFQDIPYKQAYRLIYFYFDEKDNQTLEYYSDGLNSQISEYDNVNSNKKFTFVLHKENTPFAKLPKIGDFATLKKLFESNAIKEWRDTVLNIVAMEKIAQDKQEEQKSQNEAQKK